MMNISIKPPIAPEPKFTVKPPWIVVQTTSECVDLVHEGPTLPVLNEESYDGPAFVQTLVTFDLSRDGRVYCCEATLRINMPDGNHCETKSVELDAAKMFAECFEVAP